MVAHASHPALEGETQVDHCEFKASQNYKQFQASQGYTVKPCHKTKQTQFKLKGLEAQGPEFESPVHVNPQVWWRASVGQLWPGGDIWPTQ